MTENPMDQFFRDRLNSHSSQVKPELFQEIMRKRGRSRSSPPVWIWTMGILLILTGGYFLYQSGKKEIRHAPALLAEKTGSGPGNGSGSGENSGGQATDQKNANERKVSPKNQAVSTETKEDRIGQNPDIGETKNSLTPTGVTVHTNQKDDSRAIRSPLPGQPNATSVNNAKGHTKKFASSLNTERVVMNEGSSSPWSRFATLDSRTFLSLTQLYVPDEDLNRGLHFPFCVPPCTLPDCPEFGRARRNDWYVEAFGALDFPFKKLENASSKSDFADRKDSTETMLPSFSAGFRISKNITNDWLIKTGLHYSRINEKFEYRNENEKRLTTVITIHTIVRGPGDTVVVSDTSFVEQTGTRIKTTYNHYQNIDIPLILSYEIRNPSFTIGLQGGLLFNLRSWYEGDMLDTLLVPMSTTGSDPKSQFKTSMGLGVYGGISFIKPMGSDWDLFAEPYYRKYLNSHTVPEAPFRQTIGTWGIQAGIRYKINGVRQRNY